MTNSSAGKLVAGFRFGVWMSLVCFLAGAALALSASSVCAQTKPPTSQHVEISFAGKLGDKPFACGSRYENVGTKKSMVTPQDLRFFVSDIALVTSDGTVVPVTLTQDGIWQYKSVALIDLEDGSGACRNGNAAIHKVVSGSVPPSRYVGLRFNVGIPFELDHGDTLAAPSPLNMTAMFWSWQSGYKFIRAEVAAVAAPTNSEGSASTSSPKGRSSGFPVHIGSTGCASASETTSPASPCKRPNMISVSLLQFDLSRDTVVFDLDKLLAGSDVTTNTPNTPPGCMSFENDPDCAPVMKALGLPFRDVAAVPQKVFYAEPKP